MQRCYWTRKFTTIGEWKGKLHDRHSRLNYKYSQSHHNAKSNRNSGGNCSTRGGPVIEQGQRHISGFFENDEPNTSPSPSHGSCFLGYRTRLTKNYKHITRLQTIYWTMLPCINSLDWNTNLPYVNVPKWTTQLSCVGQGAGLIQQLDKLYHPQVSSSEPQS